MKNGINCYKLNYFYYFCPQNKDSQIKKAKNLKFNKYKFNEMNIESIGTWAGEVYKALENSDTRMLGMKLLKKATKLKKDEIIAALGWLGREGKIVIAQNDEENVISLV